MSSSETPGRLVVRADGASIEVVDAFLRPVAGATGHDELTIDVPPGAYRVTARISANDVTETVVVRPGATRELGLVVAFDAAAPVTGAKTSDETHAGLAAELTSAPGPGTGSRLLLVLRGLGGEETAPLVDRPTVYDASGQLVPFAAPQRADGAAGWSIDLEPGGYRLSWPTATGGDIEQSFWLSGGWQTLLFVPKGPHGPIPSATSLHLVPDGQTWDAGAPDTREVELVLARLRGRPARLTEREWRRNLASETPALVLLTLHDLLRAAPGDRPDPERAAMMLDSARRLRRTLGDHPDVLAALVAMVPEDQGIAVPWPPMLATSVALVLEADRTHPTVVPDGSPTEETSGQQLTSSPWMLWEPDGIAWDTARSTSTIAVGRVHELTSEVGSRLQLSQTGAAEHLGAEEIGRRLGMTTRLAEKCISSLTYPPA